MRGGGGGGGASTSNGPVPSVIVLTQWSPFLFEPTAFLYSGRVKERETESDHEEPLTGTSRIQVVSVFGLVDGCP